MWSLGLSSSISVAQQPSSLCHSLLCLDRKSTRLNSSHRQISYAVFCLKKKHDDGVPRDRLRRKLDRPRATLKRPESVPPGVDEAPRRILDRLGIRPRTSLGQHFLVDSRVALRHVDHARIGPSDTVLEIGPGLGVLTRLLAERARHVVAIEADRRFAAYLRESLPGVEVIEGDALTIQWPRFDIMASNLPYQISSPLTFRLLAKPFRRAVLMYQWEFARRMIAKPGTADYSWLSVGVYRQSSCELLERVPRHALHPQ